MMSLQETIQFILSFLGGGVVVAVLNWARESQAESSRRRRDRIRQQLECLYGPLHFFASQNDGLFALVRDIHRAYDEEYSSKRWSQSEPTQSNLKVEIDATIELANTYVRDAVKNNAAIVDILRSNYAYIEVEDERVFAQFILDQARLRQESPDERLMKTPFRIYRQLGEISFMRPEFSQRVRQRFNEKVSVL